MCHEWEHFHFLNDMRTNILVFIPDSCSDSFDLNLKVYDILYVFTKKLKIFLIHF